MFVMLGVGSAFAGELPLAAAADAPPALGAATPSKNALPPRLTLVVAVPFALVFFSVLLCFAVRKAVGPQKYALCSISFFGRK